MGERMIILDPSGQAQVVAYPLARRPMSLDGLTLGVFNNQKRNADKVLDAVVARLQEKFNLGGVVTRVKRIQSQGAPPELLQEVIKSSSVVIHGVGD